MNLDCFAFPALILGVAALILYGVSSPRQRAQLIIGAALTVVGLVLLVL
jgi:hypothetical protein